MIGINIFTCVRNRTASRAKIMPVKYTHKTCNNLRCCPFCFINSVLVPRTRVCVRTYLQLKNGFYVKTWYALLKTLYEKVASTE